MAWGGNMSGWQTRPYCWQSVGHLGPHWAQIERVNPDRSQPEPGLRDRQRMEWPNTLGMPEWLIETTIHGLNLIAEYNDIPATNSISLEVLNALLQAERRGA